MYHKYIYSPSPPRGHVFCPNETLSLDLQHGYAYLPVSKVNRWPQPHDFLPCGLHQATTFLHVPLAGGCSKYMSDLKDFRDPVIEEMTMSPRQESQFPLQGPTRQRRNIKIVGSQATEETEYKFTMASKLVSIFPLLN